HTSPGGSKTCRASAHPGPARHWVRPLTVAETWLPAGMTPHTDTKPRLAALPDVRDCPGTVLGRSRCPSAAVGLSGLDTPAFADGCPTASRGTLCPLPPNPPERRRRSHKPGLPPPDTMADMDPRRLRIFRTVVRNGSIGAGARELGWTQPAVSQHLAALEKEVGTQLLLRSSSGVTPTEAGSRLALHAEAIAAQLHAAEEELADITALRRGTVKFGTFPSAAAVLLPPVLARLSETAPDLDVTFDELEPPDAVLALREGELDLALVFRYPCSDIDAEGTLEW